MKRVAFFLSSLFLVNTVLASDSLTPPKVDLLCVKITQNLSVNNVPTDTLLTKETVLLQKFLVSQGYFSSTPTGTFGRATQFALKAYQKKEGLTQTGSVGAMTRANISKKNCIADTTPVKDKVSSSASSSVNVTGSTSNTDGVKTHFAWVYLGKKYELSVPLSETLYQSYRQSPKVFTYKGDLPKDWTERYNSMFLTLKPDDYTFEIIATGLLSLARKERLSSDETVGLTVAFAQSIPYDFTKDLKKDHTQYPYETLYTQKGVCADKTFLAYLLVKRLGYGVAILQYLDRNHQALGIKCSPEDAVDGSGYCFAETTNYLPIGVIPTSFGTGGNSALSLNNNLSTLFDATRLGKGDVFLKTEGKTYLGVSAVKSKVKKMIDIEQEMIQAKNYIASSTDSLSSHQSAFTAIKTQIELAVKNKDYQAYKELAGPYNSTLLDYQNAYKEYAHAVALYNTDIKYYNALLIDFGQGADNETL